ncbi:hypothetical protein [Luteipulveratus mongoliensis]|uniref:4-hydroxybenzoate polyprenyltransferase n=1 Tax=Luteipulveratus mongoliensis TaxID=571913 RepID=A0A0K1JIF2_9MICO|nr:hypothetical protein [Luteipulveratus mongoliensis]AKU16502.1 hypothetical protein VV02_12565 [Luteipulveratus mongoliensis]
MTSSLISFAAAEGEHAERELPMPPIGYGLCAIGFFLILLAILWSFRNTAAKLGATTPHHEQEH